MYDEATWCNFSQSLYDRLSYPRNIFLLVIPTLSIDSACAILYDCTYLDIGFQTREKKTWSRLIYLGREHVIAKYPDTMSLTQLDIRYAAIVSIYFTIVRFLEDSVGNVFVIWTTCCYTFLWSYLYTFGHNIIFFLHLGGSLWFLGSYDKLWWNFFLWSSV